MKRIVLRIIFSAILLNAVFFLSNCRCPGDCGSHGTFDENCDCNCEAGWSGPDCDIHDNNSFISADLNYPSHFFYSTADIIMTKTLKPTLPDTLKIDSETDAGEFIFFQLIVSDLNLLKRDSFPITQAGGVNEVWMIHDNPVKSSMSYSPLVVGGGGKFYIDSFEVSTGRLKARFNARLHTTVGDTCIVTNGIIEKF